MKKQFLNSLKFKKFGERSFHHHLDPFLVRLITQVTRGYAGYARLRGLREVTQGYARLREVTQVT